MLLARALEKTIELRWPRLDLYTWAGNTKAVPLYKKFGFFWEDRDDSTHLMNMIPTVMHTEALAPYFEHLDWYQDSTREIVVEPDGRKENGFDYFTYSWAKGDTSLRVEFERLGRGMRLIETEDYLVSAEVEKLELVFGREYQIHYRIVNKSGKPLQLSLQGESNESIRFDYQQELIVTGEAALSAGFFVHPITEEQSVWRTHPRVSTNLVINGKSAVFHVGIVPKFPASLTLQLPGLAYPGRSVQFYLDVENNFAEEAVFAFELPSRSFLSISDQPRTLRLQGKERTSVPLVADLHDYGFYEEAFRSMHSFQTAPLSRFPKRSALPLPGRVLCCLAKRSKPGRSIMAIILCISARTTTRLRSSAVREGADNSPTSESRQTVFQRVLEETSGADHLHPREGRYRDPCCLSARSTPAHSPDRKDSPLRRWHCRARV